MEGRLIGVKYDGNFFTCEQDSTFSFEQEMLPTSGMDAGWRDYIGGYKGWSIEYSGKFTTGAIDGNSNKLIEKWLNEPDAVFELYFGARDGADRNGYFKGKARLQNGSISAPTNGSVTNTFSFIGCGKFESWWEEFEQLVNAMPAPEDKPFVIDTSNW